MTILRGEDALKFERQVKYGRPKKAAHKALERGNKLLAEYLTKGYATIHTDHDQRSRIAP